MEPAAAAPVGTCRNRSGGNSQGGRGRIGRATGRSRGRARTAAPAAGARAAGQPGPGIQPGERLEVAAVHDAFATDLLVRREPGELYALRHGIPLSGIQSTPVEGWVEQLDPDTLAVVRSSPKLPGGAWWPGGIGAHANGDIYMVFGRWAHRLTRRPRGAAPPIGFRSRSRTTRS